jgi:hypothetical protein
VTGRERILALFEGRRPDRVPVHHLQFSGHAARGIVVGCSNMIMPGTPPANIEALPAALARGR